MSLECPVVQHDSNPFALCYSVFRTRFQQVATRYNSKTQIRPASGNLLALHTKSQGREVSAGRPEQVVSALVHASEHPNEAAVGTESRNDHQSTTTTAYI